MELKIRPNGIWLDGNPIKRVTQIEIKRIGPNEEQIEAVLHIDVDRVDAQYEVTERQPERSKSHV